MEFISYMQAPAWFKSPNETGKSPVQIDHADLIVAG